MPAAQEQATKLAVLGTVAFYMFVAISMTLLNKRVLSSTPLPVFLLFCQSAVGVVLLGLENRVGPYKTPKFDPIIAKELVPLTAVNVLGLVFNNYCLQYVDASFHQVARGLVLPFTILISLLVLRSKPSSLTAVAAGIVTFGFFSGVIFDPNHASSSRNAPADDHSSLGILFGTISSMSSAWHAVLIKTGLAVVQNSPIALSYYNNLMCTAMLVPVVVIAGEGPGAVRLMLGQDEAGTFWWGALITGVFGFLISLAAFLSIKVTSPTTHMISSAARGVLQTMLAVYFFGDVLSSARVISIVLIISGSMLYVYSKSEGEKKPAGPTEAAIPLVPQDVESRGGDVVFDEKAEAERQLDERLDTAR